MHFFVAWNIPTLTYSIKHSPQSPLLGLPVVQFTTMYHVFRKDQTNKQSLLGCSFHLMVDISVLDGKVMTCFCDPKEWKDPSIINKFLMEYYCCSNPYAVPNKESWLEVYKIPKDTWIKEIEASATVIPRSRKPTVADAPPPELLQVEMTGTEQQQPKQPTEEQDTAPTENVSIEGQRIVLVLQKSPEVKWSLELLCLAQSLDNISVIIFFPRLQNHPNLCWIHVLHS